MSSLFVALFAFVASSFRSRAALQADILALRHQLAVFQNNAPRRLRLLSLAKMPSGAIRQPHVSVLIRRGAPLFWHSVGLNSALSRDGHEKLELGRFDPDTVNLLSRTGRICWPIRKGVSVSSMRQDVRPCESVCSQESSLPKCMEAQASMSIT
jgi:hypothetical protein